MTLNQIKMVLSLAAIYGEELEPGAGDRAARGGGPGLRLPDASPARSLDIIPGPGWVIKGGHRLHGHPGDGRGGPHATSRTGPPPRRQPPRAGSRAPPMTRRAGDRRRRTASAQALRGGPWARPEPRPADRRRERGRCRVHGRGRTSSAWSLAFPDTYEIGISNQALQILYHLAARLPGVGVERVYLPWVDVIAELRARAHSPADPRDLDAGARRPPAGHLPAARAHVHQRPGAARPGGHRPARPASGPRSEPLVVAGGPATANFLPVAPVLRRGRGRRRGGGLPRAARGVAGGGAATGEPRASA